MIADLLRTETAKNHKTLENLMFVDDIMNKTLDITQYKKLIAINYVIHQQLENKLADQMDKNIAEALNLSKRFKLHALQKDLQYWEIEEKKLNQLHFDLYIPKNNLADTLGAFYVLEGATLGGNVIKKNLLANENFSKHPNGFNYYGVYGAELGAMWKNFITILNKNVAEIDYSNCVNSANLTFNNMILVSKTFA